MYDPISNTWTQSVSLSGFRLGFCAVASETEEELFIVGGIDQSNERRRVESLNLTSMEWSRLADLNSNRSSLACARLGEGILASGGWGYVDNGDNMSPYVPVRSVEFYDLGSGNVFRRRGVKAKAFVMNFKIPGLISPK